MLDPFAGSGTTIIAAEEAGRIAYTMELDSRYVDVAVKRWKEFTGEEAVHAVTGRAFEEAGVRLGPPVCGWFCHGERLALQ